MAGGGLPAEGSGSGPFWPSPILWGGMAWGNPLHLPGWAIHHLCGPCRTWPSCKARMRCHCWHPPRRCCVLDNEFKVPRNPGATYQVCWGLSHCALLTRGSHQPRRHCQRLGQQPAFHPTPRPHSLPSILRHHILFPCLPNPGWARASHICLTLGCPDTRHSCKNPPTPSTSPPHRNNPTAIPPGVG